MSDRSLLCPATSVVPWLDLTNSIGASADAGGAEGCRGADQNQRTEPLFRRVDRSMPRATFRHPTEHSVPPRSPLALARGLCLRARLIACRLTSSALTYVDARSLPVTRGARVWVLRKAMSSCGLRGLA